MLIEPRMYWRVSLGCSVVDSCSPPALSGRRCHSHRWRHSPPRFSIHCRSSQRNDSGCFSNRAHGSRWRRSQASCPPLSTGNLTKYGNTIHLQPHINCRASKELCDDEAAKQCRVRHHRNRLPCACSRVSFRTQAVVRGVGNVCGEKSGRQRSHASSNNTGPSPDGQSRAATS